MTRHHQPGGAATRRSIQRLGARHLPRRYSLLKRYSLLGLRGYPPSAVSRRLQRALRARGIRIPKLITRLSSRARTSLRALLGPKTQKTRTPPEAHGQRSHVRQTRIHRQMESCQTESRRVVIVPLHFIKALLGHFNLGSMQCSALQA